MTMKEQYEWLNMLNKMVKTSSVDKEVAEDVIAEAKRKIRKITNKRTAEGSIFHEDFDGFILKRPFPEYIKTREEAEQYFEEYEHISYRNYAWDCTGQRFTRWFKIFQKPNGEWWYYHSVGLDV